jgi:hypothetical protein
MEYEKLLEEKKSRMAGQERNPNKWINESNETKKKWDTVINILKKCL